MNYQYTQNSSKFTDAQRLFYENNGYILIKNNVKVDLLDKICQRFVDICDEKVDFYTGVLSKDVSLKNTGVKGQYVANKLSDFLYDDIFAEYAENKDVLDIVECIVGPNVTAIHSMLINKPPNAAPVTSMHPLHQDLHYFPLRPADKIVAAWTAMERVNEKNGCLYVIPGSHTKSILYEHSYPKGSANTLYKGVQRMDHVPKVNLIMDKGDTVFFHPLLLHGSWPNVTEGFRKSISVHYADSNCYIIDIASSPHKETAEEAEKTLKQKGFGISFVDYWKLKMRRVRGTPGHLQPLKPHL